MVRRPGLTSSVDAWVAKLARPQRDVVNALRRIIREAAPELEETIKWGQPCYVRGRANVCYLAPVADRVNFGFFRGTDLHDPGRLLEGTGKNLRHVKIDLETPLPVGPLSALVRQAAAIGRG